ncbi:hypothetical protein [Kibdelosporangium phytohabitans]|uniref:FAD-binding domain-containing protein n=1 Tax=Kibdelosporangium phytohabitans TaxID=860235 RepID=A0A0N9I588_9PSEU|nr:hypothetical protein [Kibdelosporangium phytohabitans]ALG09837.1 hypothetical protein AOZ06_25680 [Kibdelosporangium phytohabitans]MBE1468774.1 2-polyprenyl-6-methoxyphenol hydroxylase-like FAD-dependent oxidoreductase [Kibdelosporangium phytohabitans]
MFGPEQAFTTDLGRMLAVHPWRDTPLVNFTFRAAPAHGYDRHDVALRKRIVAEAYAGVGWRAPEFIAAYQHPAPYSDPLTNVRLARWSRGRVALLGDAASAAALLGGGSSMATEHMCFPRHSRLIRMTTHAPSVSTRRSTGGRWRNASGASACSPR